MMKNWCKYFFLLAGLVVLVHVLVPHHHHTDEIFFEEATHEHHHGGDVLDEQIITAATVEQDVDAIAFECVCAPAASGCLFSTSYVAEMPRSCVSAYLDLVYTYYVCHSGGLRAPPAC